MTPCGLYQLQSQLVSSTTPCGPIWPHMTPCQPQLSSNKSLPFQNSTQYDLLWTLSAPDSTCIFNHPLRPHQTPYDPIRIMTFIKIVFNVSKLYPIWPHLILCGLLQLLSQVISSITPCGPTWPHLTPCQPSQSSINNLSVLNSTPCGLYQLLI